MKNKALILEILHNRGDCTVTELMKILYLIDLGFFNINWNKISNFEYIRYNYWPFDKTIYTEIEELITSWLIRIQYIANPKWEEIIKYWISDNSKISWIISEELEDPERLFITEILSELEWLNASSLTNIAYQTEPMKQLGATLWGTEHFMESVL